MILGEKSGFQGFEHCTLIIRAKIAKINRNFRPFSFCQKNINVNLICLKVVCYRGVTTFNAKNVKALSWTLDRSVVEWFASRFDEDGTVYQAQINGCLSDINNQAEAMFIRQIKEMAEKQGVTEALKAENQMEWAGRINNICNQATEFVNAELIYN